jgi:hypothetical protein
MSPDGLSTPENSHNLQGAQAPLTPASTTISAVDSCKSADAVLGDPLIRLKKLFRMLWIFNIGIAAGVFLFTGDPLTLVAQLIAMPVLLLIL